MPFAPKLRSGGRIVATGENRGSADKVINAGGLLVMPGGIDRHVRVAPHSAPGTPQMADGLETGTRSAIACGATTVLSFAVELRGVGLGESVMAYQEKGEGQSLSEYGFHLIITDPTPNVLGKELPALVGDGYTSFKVIMPYDDIRGVFQAFASDHCPFFWGGTEVKQKRKAKASLPTACTKGNRSALFDFSHSGQLVVKMAEPDTRPRRLHLSADGAGQCSSRYGCLRCGRVSHQRRGLHHVVRERTAAAGGHLFRNDEPRIQDL